VRSALVTGCFPHKHISVTLFTTEGSLAASTAVFLSGSREDAPSERATHVALAIRHPRLPRGKMFDFPISTVDVAPTLLALAGLEPPGEVHGRDLSAFLTAGTGGRPESIFAEGGLGTADEWRMVVRGLDKIVVRRNLELLHLFNLGEDPDEEHDLGHEIGYQLKVDELRALVRVWMKRTGDGVDPSGLKRR